MAAPSDMEKPLNRLIFGDTEIVLDLNEDKFLTKRIGVTASCERCSCFPIWRPAVWLLENPKFSWRDVILLLPLVVATRIRLRFSHLGRFLSNDQSAVARPSLGLSNAKEIATSVMISLALTPGKWSCLVYAVAVRNALVKKGISCRLCVGVRLPPLEAHAWVEVENVPLGDNHAHTGSFKVIFEDPS